MNVKVDTRRSFQVRFSRQELLSLVSKQLQEKPLDYEGIEVSELPERVEVIVEDKGREDDFFIDGKSEVVISWTENS